jgi:hypothetical protein
MIVAGPAVEIFPVDRFQGRIGNLKPIGWWIDLRRASAEVILDMPDSGRRVAARFGRLGRAKDRERRRHEEQKTSQRGNHRTNPF